MLNKPTTASRNTPHQNKHATSTPLRTAQYGYFLQNRISPSLPERGAFLLDLPGESLTHITSYLDVPALLNLSRVSKTLYKHVNNDSTWHRALLCQFLGVSPESDPQGFPSLVLRRVQSTWKKEFVHRCITSTRWERSRTSTITYSPLTGRISDIRLVSEGGLLAFSAQYGVVSRSNPLNGKVLRGFLDAAGTLNGLGIGNPNAEFSPNVSLCRIFTERSTAKILWGFTHGEVAATIANKVADPSRTTSAKFSRSLISEQHNGTVIDAVWGRGGDVFLTAGIDGKVKLWDVIKMRCLWTSPMPQDLPFSTFFPSRIDFDSQKGIAVAMFSNGDLFVWWGLSPLYVGDSISRVDEVVIPVGPQLPPGGTFHLILDTTDGLSLLFHHPDSGHFHRHNIDTTTRDVETVRFGEEIDRSIKSLRLITTTQAVASPFVLVGDCLGSLSVYDWNSPRERNGGFIQPVKRIAAFDDGDAVLSIEWNPWVMVTGSSAGTVKVWDSLKFNLLRTFQPQARGYTGEPFIALEREMIVIAFGDKVTTWKAGPVRKGNRVIHASKKGKSNALAKWRQQVDMHRDISESQREIEEEQDRQRAAYNRERDQLGSLEALGLNEREALEYVLMLSRDEEERRDPTFENPPTPPSSTQPRPIVAPSNVIVQTSPRAKLEVWSTGVVGSPGSPEMARSMPTSSDEKEFPVVSESISSRGSDIDDITTPIKPERSSGSPPSAWNTPLKMSPEPGTASPKRMTATASMSRSTSSTITKAEYRSAGCEESQEDKDLKLAIELSLAEAAKK